MNGYRQSAQLLRAIAHPARLRLLNALRDNEECVCHLTALLGQRQAYVSQQLMFLRRVRLIQDRKDGLRTYYRIKDPRVFEVLDAANALWGLAKQEKRTFAGCPCPKCEGRAQRRGGKAWTSKSSGRAVRIV